MADPISGELVIVPDAEAIATIAGGDYYSWSDAIAFAAAYDDGTNTDFRLITKAEAVAIFENAELLAQIGLDDFVSQPYWTIENFNAGEGNAWAYDVYDPDKLVSSNIISYYYALPIRKVNFYGLPLIDSEFGGGLVFDVVAETRTVSIAAKWAEVTAVLGGNAYDDWGALMALFPVTLENTFTSMPTRAQALKIFGNSYLVTLAGLRVDNDYWTSEEEDLGNAYSYDVVHGVIDSDLKTELFYALPVRSEVVPET